MLYLLLYLLLYVSMEHIAIMKGICIKTLVHKKNLLNVKSDLCNTIHVCVCVFALL